MEYKINELSKVLGLSKEMIRYYEKCGAITPSRSAGNNYRVYSTMDYFSLTEAISPAQFHANIKDIYGLKNKDFAENVKQLYNHFIRDTEDEIQHKTKMKQRAEELLDRMSLGELNRGNFWVKRERACTLYPLVSSVDDNYGRIQLSEPVVKWLHSAKVLPFCDGIIEFQRGQDQWWLGIAERYLAAFQPPACGETKALEEGYCLCIVIDMGEIGSFSSAAVRDLIAEIQKKPYPFTGVCRGILLGRGNSRDALHRLIELQMPLEKP